MAYISEAALAKAREMDLLTYLNCYEPGEIVKIGHNRYCTRTHDSLKIDKGKWFWWSRGIGGRSALDYLVSVKAMDFRTAVEHILSIDSSCLSSHKQSRFEETYKAFEMPEKAPDNFRVYKYLTARGIDKEIVGFFIERGQIYESLPYHNVVFAGYDENGNMKYAAYRSTNDKKIMGEVSGSKKSYSFSFSEGRADTLHVFESAIDMLSYATLIKRKGFDWKNANLISLGGVSGESGKLPIALQSFLDKKTQIKKVYLHLDNDEAGRKSSQNICKILNSKYDVIDYPPKKGKDFNEYLCLLIRNEEKKYGEDKRNDTERT